MPKTEFLDIRKTLVDAGLGLTNALVPAKIEGLAFGADVTFAGRVLHTLWVTNDNDFVPGVAGANQFFVYGISDAELGASFQTQAIAAVPEPTTYALMLAGLGVMGWSVKRRS